MSFAGIYFILGLAMLLVVLWDYSKLPATAKRLTKRPAGPAAQQPRSQFSRIALDVRNLAVMGLFALFLWPLILLMELLDRQDR